nr:glycosyltransferase [uncultured Pseudodesulfovibrio sp.]
MTNVCKTVYTSVMAADIRTLCLIDGQLELEKAFIRAGLDVFAIHTPQDPFFDLPIALERAGKKPDLVLQVERMASRTILIGLDQVDAPVMLWCIDPHLNAHWHSVYARLFDVVCSTQKAWIDKLGQSGAPDIRWLPWYGHQEPFIHWNEREHGLTFVGRVTDQRPTRKWMVGFLRDKTVGSPLTLREGLAFPDMMTLYRASRVIPNESIFGEVNFRLFEGASCGCLVLGQDIEEQAELFEPGREMDTYSHVVELGEKLSMYQANPRLAGAMGRAAHARIKAEHLPDHRAARILEFAADAGRNRVAGREADKWTALTACALAEAGLVDIAHADLLSRLASVSQDAEVVSMALRVQTMAGVDPVLEQNVMTLLTNPAPGDVSKLNQTASLAALKLNNFDAAKAFWYRYLEAKGIELAPPESPKELLTLWAKDLARRGCVARQGFSFDMARHLPGSAAECLLTILEDEPNDLPTLRLLDSMLRPLPGLEQSRVGFLSILTLFKRDDWRLALEIGLANLASYRLDSGLEELRLGLNIAMQQGQEVAFMRVLKNRDSSGMIVPLLNH